MSIQIAREQSLYTSYASSGIPSLRRDLASLQEQLGSGKRVNRPSDDPTDFARARALESLERRYEGHTRTIGNARLWSDRTQSTLDTLSERFTEAYEKGIQGLNDTLGPDERNALADRIDAIFEEVVDGLNAKAGSEYLFGGTRTTTPPVDENGAATGDLSGLRNRQISPEVEIAVNVPGGDVLDTGAGFTVTESLRTLADALRGVGLVELDEAVEQVTTSRDHLIGQSARAGDIGSRLNLAEARIADATVETARLRSATEDADYYQVVSDFQKTQATLEAALRTTASVSQTTLLDYLR